MSTLPGDELLIWTDAWPEPLVVVLLEPTNDAPAVLFTRLKFTVTPEPAADQPDPLLTCTVAVTVCGSSTWLVALAGPMSICASTYVLSAGLPLLPVPSVVSVTVVAPKTMSTVADASNDPADVLLIVRSHVALMPSPATDGPVTETESGVGVTE